ncbi:DUF397 domain-containing protein [Streptomyces sp. NPDC086787]
MKVLKFADGSAEGRSPGTVHVRDSKHTEGPRIHFAPATWADFVPYASRA